MRTKRHTSFIPDIGDKTSPGSARQSRQRRRKQLHRKRGCNKLPGNRDIQFDRNRQKKYYEDLNRESRSSCYPCSKELTVDYNCAQTTPLHSVESADLQDCKQHLISTTTALCMKNEGPSYSHDVESNVNYEVSSFSILNEQLMTPQNISMMEQLSCEQMFVEQDALFLDATLPSSEEIQPDNLTLQLGSTLELLDDSRPASSCFHLESDAGKNWSLDKPQQQTDFGGSLVSDSKTESSHFSCNMFGTCIEEHIFGRTVEEQELIQGASLECRLQLSEQTKNSNQRVKSNDEDLFEVIWQSLFEPHRCHKVRKIATEEQQPSASISADATFTRSSFSPSREKKMNFCSPFWRRLYSHH